MKITAKQKAYIEHYIYATLGTAAGIVLTEIQSGKHDWKQIAWSVVGGVVGPLLAKVNPKSLANKISNETGIPAAPVETGIEAGIKKADTVIADNTK